MIKHLYAYYNNLGGFFGSPFAVDNDAKQYLEIFNMSLYSQDRKTLESLCEDDLYYVGTFDTNTGIVESSKEFLIHVDVLAKAVIAKKYGNVEEQPNN